MNLYPQHRGGQNRKENGFATIVFISLLTIMVLLAMANTMALIHLHREVKLLEQQQIKRLNESQGHPLPATGLAVATSDTK